MGPMLCRGHESAPRISQYVRDARAVSYSGLVGGAHLDKLAWLADNSDVIYTVETPYTPELYELAAMRDTKVVLHAMPELLNFFADGAPDAVWLPTTWREEYVRAAFGGPVSVVPVPVALDRFQSMRRGPRNVLLHVAGPAMLDRAGTMALQAALAHVAHPMTLRVAHAAGLRTNNRLVTISHVHEARDYWKIYDGVGGVVAPRRYGGLSLIANEAAALGVPIITLDRAPDNTWPHALRAPGLGDRDATMKGGRIPVAQSDARALAARINQLISGAPGTARLGADGQLWAWSNSWAWRATEYRELLGRVIAGQGG